MADTDSSVGEFTALRVDGEEIDLHDLLSAAKLLGQLDFVEESVNRALVRAAAARMGIEVSDEELQQAADGYRLARKLYAAQATHDWLAAIHVTQEDWEALLEDEILWRKVRHAVCEGRIEQHFAENRRALDQATVAQIVVAEESVARELRAQCVDDQVPFYQLALQFPDGRFAGRLRRRQMEPMVSAAIFGAAPGDVAGPVRTERGWIVALVEKVHPATLDDETREQIAAELFADWLSEQRRGSKIEMPVLTEL